MNNSEIYVNENQNEHSSGQMCGASVLLECSTFPLYDVRSSTSCHGAALNGSWTGRLDVFSMLSSPTCIQSLRHPWEPGASNSKLWKLKGFSHRWWVCSYRNNRFLDRSLFFGTYLKLVSKATENSAQFSASTAKWERCLTFWFGILARWQTVRGHDRTNLTEQDGMGQKSDIHSMDILW